MERHVRFFQTMLISWLTFAWCVETCFADALWPTFVIPSLMAPNSKAPLYIMLGCFFATLIIEYPVIYLLLGRRLKSKVKLFLWVLLINAITFPGVQLALIAVPYVPYDQFAWLCLCLIEFAVVIVEFVLLKLIFNRMYRVQTLDEPISAKRTFVMALTANLASFLLGIIAEAIIISFILGRRPWA